MKRRILLMMCASLFITSMLFAAGDGPPPGEGGAGLESKDIVVLVTRSAGSLDPQQSVLRFIQKALPGVWGRARLLLKERMFEMKVQMVLQQIASQTIQTHIDEQAAEGNHLTPEQVSIPDEVVAAWREQILTGCTDEFNEAVDEQLSAFNDMFTSIVGPYLGEDTTWGTFDDLFQLSERIDAFVAGIDGMIGALPLLVRAFTTEAMAGSAATWLQTNWALLKGVLQVMKAVAVTSDDIRPIVGDSADEVAALFGPFDEGLGIYERMAHIIIAVTAGTAGNVQKGFYCALMYALRNDCLPAALSVPVLFITDIPSPALGEVVAPSVYNSLAVDGDRGVLGARLQAVGEARVGYLMPFVDNPEVIDPYLQMLLNFVMQAVQSDMAKKNEQAALFAQMMGVAPTGEGGPYGDDGSTGGAAADMSGTKA